MERPCCRSRSKFVWSQASLEHPINPRTGTENTEKEGGRDLGLSGKTVIVTGGGSNLGRGVVLGFAAEGANVVCVDIDEKIGRKTVDDANALRGGGRTLLVISDATDRPSIDRMVKQTLDEFGQIDVLANVLGGALQMGSFLEKPVADFKKELDLNFWSCLHCTQAVAPHMIERKQGVIVNFGSGSGTMGSAQLAGYSASKGAVISFTKAMAREFGPSGIRVNCVCPGMIRPRPEDAGEVRAWHQWGFKAFEAGAATASHGEFLNTLHLTRPGEPRDIANVVVFLASERTPYVNGQTVAVDGGDTMR